MHKDVKGISLDTFIGRLMLGFYLTPELWWITSECGVKTTHLFHLGWHNLQTKDYKATVGTLTILFLTMKIGWVTNKGEDNESI